MSKDKQQKNKSNTGTASAVLQFHDRPLAYKLSVAVALLLVICMSLMILISAVIAGRSLNKTVSGEFNGIATENALIVQSVIDTASNTATTIQNYMLDRYDEYSKNGYSGEVAKSEVYDVDLQEMNKRIEEFLISMAASTVTNNEAIDGVGVSSLNRTHLILRSKITLSMSVSMMQKTEPYRAMEVMIPTDHRITIRKLQRPSRTALPIHMKIRVSTWSALLSRLSIMMKSRV